jgi:hypothetical protein
MSRAGTLIGLIALLFAAVAQAQAPGADVRQPGRTWPVINLQSPERIDTASSATRPDFFLPRRSTGGILGHQDIYRVPPEILTASVLPNSAQGHPGSLDVADRVVTVWLVRYIQDSSTSYSASSAR